MSTTVRMRGPVAARAVGALVPQITRKSFAKFGFSTASLLMDWPRIAGAGLAGCTVPERLRWPRRPDEPDEQAVEPRRGATLILRVDPARALEAEYQARQILERVNAYFGYRAVAELRLIQAPLSREDRRVGARAGAYDTGELAEKKQNAGSGQDMAPYAEDPLSQALARLKTAMDQRRPG